MVAVTYGYSRDHREDLKQWMLALATTRQGDIPLYLHALDGNASDKVSLVAAVEALGEQLQGEGETPIFVADSGMYSRGEHGAAEPGAGALDQSGARDLGGGEGGGAGGRRGRVGSRRASSGGHRWPPLPEANAGWWGAPSRGRSAPGRRWPAKPSRPGWSGRRRCGT